jgi:hypothetical protein
MTSSSFLPQQLEREVSGYVLDVTSSHNGPNRERSARDNDDVGDYAVTAPSSSHKLRHGVSHHSARQHMKKSLDCATSSGLRSVRDKLLALPCRVLSQWGIELPLVMVVGSTSSGKTSLLTNLTGLELPVASTLTTRCPVLLQVPLSLAASPTLPPPSPSSSSDST